MADPPAPPPIPPPLSSKAQPQGPSSSNPHSNNQTSQHQLKPHNPNKPTATHPAPGAAAAPSIPPRGLRSAAGGEKISYANIVQDPRGPSFIRAHSKAVASFGALPDIVAAPRISAIGGEPSVTFTPEELQAAEDIFKDAVVIKFLAGRPTWDECHSAINSWGLKQEFVLGPLDSRSILIRFREYTDMLAVLARESTYIKGFPYRAYRWNRLYNVKEDAAFAPVWVSFPRLPIPFYVPSMLKGIANSIGKLLCFDRSTTLMTRASAARVCIEIDLRKKPPSHVWIGVHGKFRQPIIYEKLPKFCNFCKMQGHLVEECKKVPIDKSDPINHGVYDSMIHNGNVNAMPIPPNNVFVANPAVSEGTMEVTAIHPPPPPQSNYQEPHPAANQRQEHEQVQVDLNNQSAQLRSESHVPCNRALGPQVGGLDICMTDSLNQHPPARQSELPVPNETTCPPGVQKNAAQDKFSSLNRQEAITTSVSPIKVLPHLSKSSTKEVKSTHQRKQKKAKAPLNSDQQDQFGYMAHSQATAIEQSLLKAHRKTYKEGEDDSSGSEPTPSPRQRTLKEHMRASASNSFAALQDGQEDDEDLSLTIASCDSDTEDGQVEPIDMSNHSADEHLPLAKLRHIPSKASPGLKKNKRHPNVPSHVQLRARKGSSPSSP